MNARKRMLVLCPFPQGVAAGQRLKYEQYFDDWRMLGFDIDISSYMDGPMWKVVYQKGHLLEKALGVFRGHLRRIGDMLRLRRYDVIYVFMWVTPFGTSTFEKIVRAQGRKVIYDVEDNVFSQQKLNKEDNPNALVSSLRGPSKAAYLIRSADQVITSSPFLNDYCLGLRGGRGGSTYISSSVDTERFRPGEKRSTERVTIGWTGTYSSKPFLDLLEPVFKRLAERVAFKLRVIGNFQYELAGIDLEMIQWSSEREVSDLQGIDIGVYPLPIDDWVFGKSGLKAIQYMAFGLPCVATDVGTTPLLIRDGENGLLVRSEDEWLHALERLIADPALRERLGAAAREDAVAKYSVRAVAKAYRAVLESVNEDA